MLLEQHRGQQDGDAEHGGGRAHPAPPRLLKDAAAVVGQPERHRVEDVDGGADAGGGVRCVQQPHRFCKNIIAVHPVGPQVQPRGQDDVARQRKGHARKQRDAQPPEIGPGRFPQQVEQGKGDPEKPGHIGHDGQKDRSSFQSC